MGLKITNNGYGQLASGITDVATSLEVKAGQGASFPYLSGGDYFYCTLQKSNGVFEIVKVTARSGDLFTTIVRSQDGTANVSFLADDIVSLRPVRAVITDLQSRLDGLELGTASATFQLDNDNTGPKLKNNSGVVEFRNAADAAYSEGKAKQFSLSDAFPTQIYHAARKDYVDNAAIPSGTKMYFYQNTAPSGWVIDGAVTDILLSVKGGSQAYNVNGGTQAGVWAQPAHLHTGPNHTHTGPNHTHTGPNHTHTGPNHTHIGPSHTHTGPSHTHTGPSHTHTINITTNGFAVEVGTNALTSATAANDGTGNTGAEGTGATGAEGTGTTGGGGTGATGAEGTGATGGGGTGATGGGGTADTGTSSTASIWRPLAAVGIIATRN